jgi:hypothetical protein
MLVSDQTEITVILILIGRIFKVNLVVVDFVHLLVLVFQEIVVVKVFVDDQV